MTTGEMTPEERARAAQRFLEQSDEEFDAGDRLQASEKLYGAACHAVNAIAQRRAAGRITATARRKTPRNACRRSSTIRS